MKITKLLLISTIIAAPITGMASELANKDTPINFVQIAKKATIAQTKQNQYRLTLNGASSNTDWFASRPQREAGTISTTKYTQLWSQGKDNFNDDPPNAAIVGNSKNNGQGQNISYMLSLENPVYQADKGQLSYTIDNLNTKQKLPTSQTLYNASVYIDKFCPWC